MSCPIKTIVHLWGVEGGGAELCREHFEHAQNLGFHSVVALVQALGQEAVTNDLDLLVVTRNVHRVTGVERLTPAHAPVTALCKVAMQENPNITCRAIDVDAPGAELGASLLRELMVPSSDLMVAYRAGTRWVQAFEPAPLPPARRSPWRPGGVYLITGGFGEIGLTLAAHLGKTVHARLALLGRTPTAGQTEKIAALAAQGVEAVAFAADVADETQMRVVLEQVKAHFGAVHGVIHAAGITRGECFQPIQNLTRGHCEPHFQSKVYGLMVLDKLLREEPLDCCILFSSVSAMLGGLAFAPYAAANAFMDSFAHYHNAESAQRWTAVNWDTWHTREKPHGDIGTTLEQFSMCPEEALDAFDRVAAIGSAATQVVNSTGDLDARFNQWVRQIALDGADERPLTVHPRPALATGYAAPTNETEQTIVCLWQRVLGTEVGIHDNFFELGGNSLIGTQLIGRLRQSFQTSLPLNLLFEAPTVAQMAVAVELALIEEIDREDSR